MQTDVAELIANGQPLTLFGDNLFLDLDLSATNLPPGSLVRIGGATMEVTPKPHNGCQKFRARFGSEALRFVSKPDLRRRNLRGIYMRVVQRGEVAAGDPVEVITRAASKIQGSQHISLGATMRSHDWTGFAALAAGIVSLVEIARGSPAWAFGWFLLAGVAAGVTRYWSVKYPGPMPHLLRWTLLVPRGNHSPQHLLRVLEPRRGERILEIGPGIGIHAVPVASSLAPDGVLDVLDMQQAMLDDVMRRAAEAGITNITPTQGSAQKLPYPDGTFDGAYLVGVLGEIPDGQAALQELRRVLKPSGRLVIGEIFFDPDFVFSRSLQDLTRGAGFVFERKLGRSLSYLARFRAAERP